MNATTARNRLCAHYQHFSFKDANETQGIGRCGAGLEVGIDPLMPWNTSFCVLFGPAPDMSKRTAWISKREAK